MPLQRLIGLAATGAAAAAQWRPLRRTESYTLREPLFSKAVAALD